MTQDHYAAPKTPVDDGLRERRSWRNAAIALVAGVAGELGLLTLGFSMTGKNWDSVVWRWQAVAALLGPALPVAILAWRIPRRFGWWVALLAPVAAVTILIFVGFINHRLHRA